MGLKMSEVAPEKGTVTQSGKRCSEWQAFIVSEKYWPGTNLSSGLAISEAASGWFDFPERMKGCGGEDEWNLIS